MYVRMYIERTNSC